MYTRDESKKIRQEFWTSFGRDFPRKWILYDTKIKELELKFTFTNEFAQVSLDVISSDDVIRSYYFEKLVSLRNILLDEYLSEAIFEDSYLLPEGKVISRLYVQLEQVNIHNKKDWPKVQHFLNQEMDKLEEFFIEYKDYLEA
ncbi:MAG TPA: DUF4268 domain-containing protein [Salinimicrobium sp.]|nr:DUF4268 domain-containing protein [Salinimicrobium sp.]